ncbi:MAG: flagellar protein FliS [Acutalibacter sp.]|jgi:flagellar protein FliS|nr:flagellar protein FliS [Acutalibacter sp.]
MENNPIQHYKEQSVNTMTPNELLLLLFDELMKNLLRCGLALDKQEYELMEASVDKAQDIIRYLDDTLDDQYPISRQLHKLYDFFGYQLGRVKFGRNKAVLDQVRPMIADLRDTFRQADRNVAEEAEKKLAESQD